MPSNVSYSENLELSVVPFENQECKGCSLNFFSSGADSGDLLVTASGKVVYENRIRIRNGVNRVKIRLEEANSGTYELSLLTPSQIRRKRFRLN